MDVDGIIRDEGFLGIFSKRTKLGENFALLLRCIDLRLTFNAKPTLLFCRLAKSRAVQYFRVISTRDQ